VPLSNIQNDNNQKGCLCGHFFVFKGMVVVELRCINNGYGND